MQVQSFKASLALEDVFLFVIVHILKRLVIAPVVSIPIIVVQCIAMCFLPVPYGEAYHAADIGQTIRVGWLGAVFIATIVGIAVVFSSLFRLHSPTFDDTPRSRVYSGPSASLVQKLATRIGFLTIQGVCMVQGVVGAVMVRVMDNLDFTATEHCLDPTQAALAGAFGAVIVQIALYGCALNKTLDAAIKAEYTSPAGRTGAMSYLPLEW